MSEVFLLEYPTYQSYLGSFLSKSDRYYMHDIDAQRMLVRLNYRAFSKIYSAGEFTERKKNLIQRYYPQKKGIDYVARKTLSSDSLLIALAKRDKPNQQKLISTIIFMRSHDKRGVEISGFIDFQDSVRRSNAKTKDSVNWDNIFEEREILRPKASDLSFIHWRTGHVFYNNTPNYKVIHDDEGLSFVYRGDHKKIIVDKDILRESEYFTRKVIFSEKYGYVTLYDHVVRKRF